MSKIAYLGLGVMGGPMAMHLARAGHEVTGYNRTVEKAHAWKARCECEGLTVSLADTPAEAARDKDFVLACLGRDYDLSAVMVGGNGALPAMRKGAIFIDHTTISPHLAKQIAYEAQERGVMAIDAPVSGGKEGAENGILSIMCGGTDAAMEAGRPIIEAYAKRIVHIGKAGAGQACKMVNQICAAGVLAGLAEGLRLAQHSHLDMDKVFEAISGGAAQSWQMENRWASMDAGEFDFGFAIDWMRKDLDIALSAADKLDLPLPITALIDQCYAFVQRNGGARQDTSALARYLPEPEE